MKAEYALKHGKRGIARTQWTPEDSVWCRGLGPDDPWVLCGGARLASEIEQVPDEFGIAVDEAIDSETQGCEAHQHDEEVRADGLLPSDDLKGSLDASEQPEAEKHSPAKDNEGGVG